MSMCRVSSCVVGRGGLLWPVRSFANLLTFSLLHSILQDKPFNITVIQAYVPTNNAEEAEVERFYEDLQDLLELIPKKMFFCLATLFLFFKSLKLFFDSSHILFSLLGMPLAFSSFCLANSYSFFMLNITFSDFSSINFHNLNSISLFTLLFFSYNIDTNINTHLCTFLLSIHLCQ